MDPTSRDFIYALNEQGGLNYTLITLLGDEMLNE